MLSRLSKENLFYGWVVVAAIFFIGAIIWGVYYSYGVFFKSIQGEFGLTRATTSLIFSIQMVLASGFPILAGWALDKYGPKIVFLLMGLLTGLSLVLTSQTSSLWQLFITYSLLLSAGTSPIYAVVVPAVSRWFDKKRGLAVGIGIAGSGLGTMVMAPFATFLISNLDWRMAYLVIGAIAWAVVVPLSLLLKRNPYEIGALPDGAKSSSRDIKPEASIHLPHLSLSQAFRTRTFWLFLFMWLLISACVLLVFTHIVPHATDLGFSPTEAAVVVSLIGGSGITGRVLMGIASDRLGRKLASVICTLLQTAAMVMLLWAQDLWMLYLFAAVYGFGYGGVMAGLGALAGDTFGLANLGAIMGMLEIGWGIGSAVGPYIGGLMFDINNSYFMAFLFGAVAMLIATLLIALIKREAVANL